MTRCLQCRRVRGERAGRDGDAGFRGLADLLDELVDLLGERLVVFAQLRGGAHERLGDARPEFGLEHGKHPLPHPHPGVRVVDVVGVVPGREPGVEAGLSCRRATDAEQRPRVAARAHGHAREARRTRAACEAEQHRLGLVVEGVAEQHDGGARLGGGRVERGIAGSASGCLRPAITRDLDAPHEHGLEPEFTRGCRCGGRDIRRPLLQAVVDDDRARPEPRTRRLERRGRGERERVGAARERDEHQWPAR